jgi:hypothetical protein
MPGSPGIAALFAQAAFWALLACGLWLGELRLRATVIFLVLWLAGRIGLPYLPNGGALFVPFVAMLDIALVLTVFKGDVRLS